MSLSHTEPVLDKERVHFKYVSSFDHSTKIFTIDIARDWRYHSDCYIPKNSSIKSAGWVSCPENEFKEDDYTNMTTWGHSIGYQIGTHPRDIKMLKGYFSGDSMKFDINGDIAIS